MSVLFSGKQVSHSLEESFLISGRQFCHSLEACSLFPLGHSLNDMFDTLWGSPVLFFGGPPNAGAVLGIALLTTTYNINWRLTCKNCEGIRYC